MVSTRAQISRETTIAIQNIDQACAATQLTQVCTNTVVSLTNVAGELTVSPTAGPDVAMKDISITTRSSVRKTSTALRSLIVCFKLPVRKQAGVTATRVLVDSKLAIQTKNLVDGEPVRQRAAATSPGIKREPSDDQDSVAFPRKKSKTSGGDDDGEFKPDAGFTQPSGVPTVHRALRDRGEDGTVTGRIRAAKKAKEDIRGPFVTFSSKSLGGFLKKMKKRRPKTPYTNKTRFQFGHDHLWYWTSPSPYEIRNVSQILEEERRAINEVAATEGTSTNPFHAGAGVSVDSIVRVILSQACTNESALDAQQRMLLAYPYWVNGKWITGKKPNYHAMRVQGLSKLEKVLKKAGLVNKKPKAIKDILDIVYERNVALLEPLKDGEVVYIGNERGAADFVPGLLSVDYLWDIYKQEGKQALLDHLVSLPLIGVKSASCLMSFNMSLPVFAVDTHVAGMAKLLG
ncbi:uncharacterized protein Z519_03191 [Cladophialophora bantiana CBS 173.52]|uniref:HhH-GPD domain-containing protein n=1 Tax=Cladophialophora bantiana (strain ATCC 10958 / CBS 173.52 / CDC B-1940 / NIH 8579) TaxID=1442370 RepID=A0A0D2IHC7_CLAB1|nr:uncharacterized protein Z519_03191 [Cladophialophora bantiana CBS 173.52]KIW96124.1 hypothetical protein Z519_03191 [Cladophialophora bantiana CBS 173.52]